MNTEDMIIDTESFDLFNQIVDEDFDGDESQEELTPDFPEGEEGEYEEEYEDESTLDETSDLAKGNYKDFGARFDEMPEDTEIVIGGRAFKRAELSELASDDTYVKTRRNAVDKYVANLTNYEEQRIMKFEMASTETDMMIGQLQDFLERDDINAEQFKQAKAKLAMFRGRKDKLAQAGEEAASAIKSARLEDDRQRVLDTHAVMSKEIPNWSTVGRDVIQYSLKAGITTDQLTEKMSPALLRMFVKAKKFDELSKGSVTKAKAGGKAPSKAPRTIRSTGKTKVVSPSKRAEAERLYSQGRLSNDNAFDFLVD